MAAAAPGSQLNWDVLLRESPEDTGCAGVAGFNGTETRAEFVQSGGSFAAAPGIFPATWCVSTT